MLKIDDLTLLSPPVSMLLVLPGWLIVLLTFSKLCYIVGYKRLIPSEILVLALLTFKKRIHLMTYK